MLKPSLKQKLKHPLTYFFLFLALLPVLWIGSAVYPYVNPLFPKNLGPGFEYVGYDSYGCWWPVPCDSDPGSTFYFATDMSPEEVGNYFKNAALVDVSVEQSSNSGFSSRVLFFKTKDGKDFGVNYYDDSKTIIDTYHLRPSAKKHVIEIDDKQYWTVRTAL